MGYVDDRRFEAEGVRGVTYLPQPDRYVARIRVGGQSKSLGTYRTVEEASAVFELAEAKRLEAKRENHLNRLETELRRDFTVIAPSSNQSGKPDYEVRLRAGLKHPNQRKYFDVQMAMYDRMHSMSVAERQTELAVHLGKQQSGRLTIWQFRELCAEHDPDAFRSRTTYVNFGPIVRDEMNQLRGGWRIEKQVIDPAQPYPGDPSPWVIFDQAHAQAA